jgi:hypothetical protein
MRIALAARNAEKLAALSEASAALTLGNERKEVSAADAF